MPITYPFTFAGAGLNTPTTQLDADFNAVSGFVNPRVLPGGPIASRPAAGNAGAFWVASDEANRLYFDNGSTWVQIGASGDGVPGASFFGFEGIATPATPASGKGRLYTPSAPSGLRRLAWLDAGGQLTTVQGALLTQHFLTISNTTTETSLFGAGAPTIKGGTLGTDRILRIRVYGDYQNNTGANRTVTLRLKYGATTVYTEVRNYSSDANFLHEHAIYSLVAFNATNAQESFPALFRTAGGLVGTPTFTTAASVEDSTADKTLDLTAQLSTASASLQYRVFRITVDVSL